MPKPVAGLHHVTAIASNPQQNLDFYTRIMGLRLAKRTVTFDDPDIFHFYFGDDKGAPGTLLTFLYRQGTALRTPGAGEVSAIAFRVPRSSLDYWEKRLAEAGLTLERTVRFGRDVLCFADPEGTRLELVGQAARSHTTAPRNSEVPVEHAVGGLFGMTLCEGALAPTAALLATMGFRRTGQEGARTRFAATGKAPGKCIDVLVEPHLTSAALGPGSVHHVALRAPDENALLDWRTQLIAASYHVSPVLDRTYFSSIQFREPGGVVLELATDEPGLTFDEPLGSLGGALQLPPWLEQQRDRLEQRLSPIEVGTYPAPRRDLIDDPHKHQPVQVMGADLSQATAAVILLHGRGASAEDILRLVDGLYDERIVYLAPEAADHRWYPYSLMAPSAENEPWLSSALAKVAATMQLAVDAGISRERMVLCGFSQGACLATEFVARYPARYGCLVAFTGGLIGPSDEDLYHAGNLAGMPAWLSSGDSDPHIPWSRVRASAEQLTSMGAEVRLQCFPGREHTVLPEEVRGARELILSIL